MDVCTQRIYSEEYNDYLVEYFNDLEYLRTEYGADCYQARSGRFAVVYMPADEAGQGNRRDGLMIPKCYGLMSSDEVLEAAGISATQRQPVLSLYGQGVIVGFIDTGAGV